MFSGPGAAVFLAYAWLAEGVLMDPVLSLPEYATQRAKRRNTTTRIWGGWEESEKAAARGLDKGTRHGSGGCKTERRPRGLYPEWSGEESPDV